MENDPLPLRPDIVGPFEEASEISFGMDVLPNAQLLMLFLKQRIHHLCGLLFFHNAKGRGHLLPLGLLFFGHLDGLEERESPCGFLNNPTQCLVKRIKAIYIIVESKLK